MAHKPSKTKKIRTLKQKLRQAELKYATFHQKMERDRERRGDYRTFNFQ